VEAETPSGAIDGSNLTFALAGSPSPDSSLQIFRNGILTTQAIDYNLTGNTIAFINGAQPQAGDLLRAYYRLVGGTGAVTLTGTTFVDREAPAGTVDGVNRSFTLSSVPNPASSIQLYRNGVLQQANTDYTAVGNGITFLPGATPQAGDVLTVFYRVAP
jgi:hypothetical protein